MNSGMSIIDFIVIEGNIEIELEDRTIELSEGEMFVVKPI